MSVDRYLRKNIKDSPTYAGVDPSDKLSDESGINSEEIIKLNANENPFGSDLNLTKNLSQINIHEYPDPNQKRLRKALSDYTGAKFEKIVASSGSDELIDILIRLFLEPNDKLIDAQPTFGMYEFFAKIQGAEVVSVKRGKDFGLNLDGITKILDDKTKMISMISSNKKMCEGHLKRLEWVEMIGDQVDLYGRGFNEIEFKEEGLCDYMFSVAIENGEYNTYFTEKLLDCFATGTITVYLGAPDIGNHFNMDGIITLSDEFDISEEIYYDKMDAIKDNLERAKKMEILEDFIWENYLQ